MNATYRDVCSHKTIKPLGLSIHGNTSYLLEDFDSKMEPRLVFMRVNTRSRNGTRGSETNVLFTVTIPD